MSNEGNPSDPGPEQPAKPTHVEARDAMGRPVRIPRDEYENRVLPELVKAHNDNPDQLAAIVMQGVQHGFADKLIPAANRLTVIDKNVERALSVLALTQREAGELDMAELTLKELEQKKPGSASAMVGLATLAERRGEHDKCEELLWQALTRDCNSPDAVSAFLGVRQRRGGDEGLREAVDKVMTLDGAWRAKLFLARALLKDSDVDGAVAIYRELFARPEAISESLAMASSDLLQAQQFDALEREVAGRFEPGKHHPHTGLALLHLHRHKQQHEAGEELLHQMWLHYGQMVGGDLQPFTAEFDRMRLSKVAPPKDLGAQPKVGLYRMDRPSWWAGYDGPDWVLPQKAQGHKHVVFIGLSLAGATQLPQGREEEISRWMRGTPLWFSEQVWLATPHRGSSAIPLAENGTWALMGQRFPEAPFVQQLPENERADTILVTGEMSLDGDRRRIEMWAYDCGRNERIKTAVAEGSDQDFGAMLIKLMGELWPAIGGPQGYKPQIGTEPFWHRYVDGLAQQSSLVVTQAGGMPKERLFGARYITQWLQTTMAAETRWQPGLWLFGSALCLLHQLGSPVPREHAGVMAQIFPQLPADSAFARLAVKPLKACGLDQLWQSRRDEIHAAANGHAGLLDWLQKAEA